MIRDYEVAAFNQQKEGEEGRGPTRVYRIYSFLVENLLEAQFLEPEDVKGFPNDKVLKFLDE